MVKVRGVNVSYSAAAINAFYELPDIEDDAYSRSEDNLDPDAILRVVGSRGATWRFNENPHQLTMESKYMDYEMKTWHRFVGAKLLPTKHFATIDIHCANLIRAIESQDCETINVGRVIQNSIMRSVQNTQLGFYHGHLITELCRCAGVRIRSNEEVLQPMHVIDRNTIARFQKPQPARPAQSEAGPSEPATSAAADPTTDERFYGLSDDPVEPHPGRTCLLQDRVATMETELYRARLDSRAQYHQMGTFMERVNEQSRRETDHYARMDAYIQRMEAREQRMEAQNQKLLEFAAYQDVCFRLQQTNLGTNMSMYPQAPMWLPPYPPVTGPAGTEILGSHHEQCGDNEGGTQVLGEDYYAHTPIVNFDEGGGDTVEFNADDDDGGDTVDFNANDDDMDDDA